MKKIVVIIFCLIILILFGIDFFVVGGFKRVLYANWQIELPGVYRHEELFVVITGVLGVYGFCTTA